MEIIVCLTLRDENNDIAFLKSIQLQCVPFFFSRNTLSKSDLLASDEKLLELQHSALLPQKHPLVVTLTFAVFIRNCKLDYTNH